MNLQIYRNFIEIIESGSLTAAAKKLLVAQPALSNQLKVLETELGVPLLIRTPHQQYMTEAGKVFYEKARLMISLEDGLRREVADCGNGSKGRLRLGLTSSTALTMFDGILLQFSKENPDICYELHDVDTFQILELLNNGAVDIGIVRTPCMITKQMDVISIDGEKMVAAYRNASFDLETKNGYISLASLKSYPLILTARYEKSIVDECLLYGFRPTIKAVSHQLITSLTLATYGLGIALLPLSSVDCLGERKLHYALIEEAGITTGRAIIKIKGRYISPAAKTFFSFCRAFFTDHASTVHDASQMHSK